MRSKYDHFLNYPGGYFFRQQYGGNYWEMPTSCKELALISFLKTGKSTFVLPPSMAEGKVNYWLKTINNCYCPIEYKETVIPELNGARFFELTIKDDPKIFAVYDMVLFLIKIMFFGALEREYFEPIGLKNYFLYSKDEQAALMYKYLVENLMSASKNGWKYEIGSTVIDLNKGRYKSSELNGLFSVLYYNKGLEEEKAFFQKAYPPTQLVYSDEALLLTFLTQQIFCWGQYCFYTLGHKEQSWAFHGFQIAKKESAQFENTFYVASANKNFYYNYEIVGQDQELGAK